MQINLSELQTCALFHDIEGGELQGLLACLSPLRRSYAKSAYLLGRKMKVELPITEQIYSVLYKGISPAIAVTRLMAREKKAE